MSLANIDQPSQSLTASVPIDHAAILRALNINVNDPKAQAMILACQKYGLDPLLKHAVLISGNLYVTRDGLLAIAHRSGLLDGIVIEDEGETAEEWWAKVTVHVKGVKYGYTYRGRYPKSGQLAKFGPEMAVKVAEVMGLRRAFGVTGVPTIEEQWDTAPAYLAVDLATPAHMAAIDALLPQVPQDAMPTLKAWKAEAGISMKAGEFTAEMADEVIAKLEELAHSLPAEEPTNPTASAHGAGGGDDKGTVDGATTGGEGETLAVPEVSGGGDAEPPTAVASSGEPAPTPLKAINESGYKSLNRKCRAIHAEHGDPDKATADTQWEALAWACSGARTIHLGELSPDEASVFRTRMVDVSEGRAVWAESDDPQWLGWTLVYEKEVAA